MYAVLKEVIILLIIVYIVSQVLLPCFIQDLEFFNLHTKNKEKKERPKSLSDLDTKAQKVSSKFKEVKKEVLETESQVKSIKDKLKTD